jgi:hypothetical protein
MEIETPKPVLQIQPPQSAPWIKKLVLVQNRFFIMRYERANAYRRNDRSRLQCDLFFAISMG